MSLYKTTGVYEIVDTRTGRSYVGQTLMNFGDRRDSHFSLLRQHRHWVPELQKAWDIDDGTSIEFLVIVETSDQYVADLLEDAWIRHYQNYGMSLNTMKGGKYQGWSGLSLSESAKKKIGEKNRINSRGKRASAETRAKMSQSQRGKAHKPFSEEAKAKIKAVQQQGLYSAKLTADDVRQIRSRREETNDSYAQIARDYRVSAQCISDICSRKRWSHIE